MSEAEELYPVFLRLAGKRCLVVGAGAVAARKIAGLLEAGALVTVVAPEAVPVVRARAEAGELAWVARTFEPSDLAGAAFAFVASSDAEANRAAVQEARRLGIPVNAADCPEECDFVLPAVLRRGAAAVAVSTGGASPVLAAWLRDRIAGVLPEEVGVLAELARKLRGRCGSASAEDFRRLFDAGVLEDLVRGDRRAVGAKIEEAFGSCAGAREVLEPFSREAL